MAAMGDQLKHFAGALAKAACAGAINAVRALHRKLPITLGLWNKLPDKGWPNGLPFLKSPPRWFVAIASGLAIWLCGWLLLRLIYGVALNAAEEVNKLLLGLAGLLSAPFVVWRTWIADQQKHIAQEQLYTNLLTKAVEQLGTTRETLPNKEVRLGAIYALEKLARDYPHLHWQVMEILCAYVRENAGPPRPCSDEIRAVYAKPWKERVEQKEDALKLHKDELREPSVDVQAALTVIGRRSERQRLFEASEKKKQTSNGDKTMDFRLDLIRCHLARVSLIDFHFEDALFNESCLEGATLEGTHFEDARLFEAHFENASLVGAHLEGADLTCAHFEGALLPETHFEGADLSETHLEGADLEGADGMTQDQIESAFGNESTTLPKGLVATWRYTSNRR